MVNQSGAESDHAMDERFDLFATPDTDDDQLDFLSMDASVRKAWADIKFR